MKENRTKILALLASAALVAMLGLAACGGGSSSASSASASASSESASASAEAASSEAAEAASSEAAEAASSEAAEAASSEAAEAEEATEEATEAASTEAASTEAASTEAAEATETTAAEGTATAAAEDLNTDKMYAYMGESSLGELFYLAINDTENEAILAVVNPETDEYASFVGDVTSPSDTQITITDRTTGNTLTFEMLEFTDEGISIDMGEQGTANLAACDINQVFEALAVIDANAKAVA